ncbi:thiolase domain-containing protein [Streptomyces brasiliensis]|uniref:Acetyl-CoA acetyltransferase n=1 Tax=Streptomyces brasiliensis TaxID=1954 RepID=A0A917NZ54_9ACTN|nr:thiolase domain-containing protein [Streptomyces brasiliensis]GGJ42818.1 acetyl-CoA acetyltransferase [Streptomyces brasiliensis]
MQVLARIAGAYEHPMRKNSGTSLQTLYQEIVAGALADAGLRPADIDGLFTSATAGGIPSLAETLGLTGLTHIDGTDLGGATYVGALGHAARAIQAGQCSVALVIMAGMPRLAPSVRNFSVPGPPQVFEDRHGSNMIAQYALVAARHMHEFGTTRRDLAEIKAAASYHASFNPNALLPREVSIEEVLESRPIAEPLHMLDCCVTTDGGGALVIVSDEVARDLGRDCPGIVAEAETIRHWNNGNLDLPDVGAFNTGPRAFAQAGLTPADIDYAGLYDSFTITVLTALEGLGFAERGKGGVFVRDGALRADGRLPFNTDGGGLCNNHPDRRGGMIRTIEAVRQLRGEAHPSVQVADCEFAIVHGSGHQLGTRASAVTAILARSDVR